MIKQVTLILLTGLYLSACVSNNQAIIQYYTLEFQASEASDNSQKPHYGFVKIDQPHLSTKHTTEAIIYSDKPYQQDIYTRSQWKEPLPVMFQEWLVQSLDSMKLFAGVMRVSSRARVSLLLESDIVKFEHLVYQDAIDVSIHMTLLEYGTRKIIKHKVFQYSEKVSEPSASQAVAAFNAVLKKFDKDLYAWLQKS